MRFLHPEFLYLAPLIAVPILIHLLNRIRYRRQRWAAIDFLLQSERRAVRRARLRQLLLMALRVLLLAAALGALAQPLLGSTMAGLLGRSTQVAVLLDASASMSASDASGMAFERGRDVAASAIESLGRNCGATAGIVTRGYESPFSSPVRDHGAVVASLRSARLTGGTVDLPVAFRAAAESLAAAGGGGTIWLITDLRAAGWRAVDDGAWEQVRQALEAAGKPRIVISDVAPEVGCNLSVVDLRVAPEVLLEGDSAKLTATIQCHGTPNGPAEVSLFLEGRRVDSRTLTFDGPGKAEVVFRLPPVEAGVQAGRIELGPDAVPGDDRYHFLIRPAGRVPVCVVDGAPSERPFEGAADFLRLALEPGGMVQRSPFSVQALTVEDLDSLSPEKFSGIFLADVPQLKPFLARALQDYVRGGGLLVVFPGAHTDVAAWNELKIPGVSMQRPVKPDGDEPFRVGWALSTSPIVASLPAEGLDRLKVLQMFPLAEEEGTEVLVRMADGAPFLVRRQVEKGKLYVFAVSCQVDYSNLPFNPVFLPVIHRTVLMHLVETAPPPAGAVFDELALTVPDGPHEILTPDGRSVALGLKEGRPGEAAFDDTGAAGVYRLVAAASAAEEPGTGVPVAALNVPPHESTLDRIDPVTVRRLLQGHTVRFVSLDGGSGDFEGGENGGAAAAAFPLAMLALVLLLGEGAMAWHLGRPARSIVSERDETK